MAKNPTTWATNNKLSTQWAVKTTSPVLWTSNINKVATQYIVVAKGKSQWQTNAFVTPVGYMYNQDGFTYNSLGRSFNYSTTSTGKPTSLLPTAWSAI